MRLPEALRYQARACTDLGSPFMGWLLTFLADHMPCDSALFAKADGWPDDLGPSAASLPLRLAGGLHALVLTGTAPPLAALYPPATPDEASLSAAVLDALTTHETFLLDWIDRPPQTNEVRRSAPLTAAAHLIAARHPLPLRVSELGASGGLNLMFDRYALDTGPGSLGPKDAALRLTPDWTGPLPPPADLTVTDRRGVDLTPLNVRDPDAVTRLFAYLWPDQPHRRTLTQSAIEAFDAQVDADDAIAWLDRRLTTQRPGELHLIYHTVAWQYFPKDRQAAGKHLIETAGARATNDTPLAWLSMEADNRGRGAGLTLRLWPGDLHIDLGRSDFHGRWVDWTTGPEAICDIPPAVAG